MALVTSQSAVVVDHGVLGEHGVVVLVTLQRFVVEIVTTGIVHVIFVVVRAGEPPELSAARPARRLGGARRRGVPSVCLVYFKETQKFLV